MLFSYVLAGDGQGDIKSTYYANAKTVWNFAKYYTYHGIDWSSEGVRKKGCY